MKSVKVGVKELKAKLRANREEHRNVFLAGQEKFRAAVIEKLDAMLADARAGKEVDQFIGLAAPEDHTRDYDRVIAMLDMSVDEVIELSAQEFQQYVMDQWAWARQFGDTVASYGISSKYSQS